MAQFKQWALEYVLSDDEPVQLEIAKKAAKGEDDVPNAAWNLSVAVGSFTNELWSAEIESSRASSTVVGNWAASVQQWMTPPHADDDEMEDGDEGGSGDIIARAKGIPVSLLFSPVQGLSKG